MKETIGFIGLGGMGLAMATNLVKAGVGLRVFNRTAEKAQPLLELGAHLARSPVEAVSPGGVVVTSPLGSVGAKIGCRPRLRRADIANAANMGTLRLRSDGPTLSR